MSLNASFGEENAFKVDEPEKYYNLDNKEQNTDIFNSIPIEIENEETKSTEYYDNIALKEKIFFNLNIIFSFIEKKLTNKQIKFFFRLKQKSDEKYSKLINAQILYMLIETSFKSLRYICHKKKIDILNYAFTRIKNYNELKIHYKEYESKKNIIYKKSIEESEDNFKKIEKKYKEKKGDIDEIKNKIEIQNKELDEIKKRNKNLEEKYNELTGKNKELKEIISLSRQKSAKYNFENDINEEKYILELENKIKMKEQEREKQFSYCELFYQSMNYILSQYESKYDTIKSTINTTNQNI